MRWYERLQNEPVGMACRYTSVVALGTGIATRSRRQASLHGDAVRAAPKVLWEASDRVCGKRLMAVFCETYNLREFSNH